MADNIASELRKGRAFEKIGNWASAELCYRAILSKFPKNVRARKALADVKHKSGVAPTETLQKLSDLYRAQKFADVAALAETQSREFPRSEKLWNLLGAAAERLGDLNRAKHAFCKAAEINPKRASGHANIGAILERQGLFDEALPHFSQALHLAPATPKYLLFRGNALFALENFADAITDLEACVELDPNNHKAQQLLGDARRKSGRPASAASGLLDAVKLLEADSLQNPGNAGIHTQLAETYESLANAYCAEDNKDAAIAAYEKALHLNPKSEAALANKLHTQIHQCDWRAYREFDEVHKDIGIDGGGLQPWAFLGFEDNPAKQRLRSEVFARQWSLARPAFPPRNEPTKLRIGYFSSDLYDHATLVLLTGMLEHHDRESFEVFFYGLTRPRESALFSRLLSAVEHFRDLSDLDGEAAVASARQDALDIAIDLKGYTEDARTDLFFAGLAPVQINYLGYPGTLGSTAFDYIVADATVIPDCARAHYTESVIALPHSYQPNDRVQGVARTPTHEEAGLPEDVVVLCCFNSNYKITPAEFDIWMRLMRKHNNTVLWLLDGGETPKQNLRKEAELRGVNPERLVFAPKVRRDRHLARHRLADLFLDTFNVNAHTTASDALYTGLPVITRAGSQFAARVGASLCCAVGMDNLVASDSAEYEAMIDQHLQNPDILAATRDRLARNLQNAPLFQTEAYTRHLEAGFQAAWDNWQAGKAPTSIQIKAD